MAALLLGAICISFSPLLVKLIELSPTMIGVYRCLVAGPILLAVAHLFRGAKPWRELPWIIITAGAVFFAADIYFWHRAVVIAGAGIGTILSNTQVFYLAAIGILLWREPLTWRFTLSTLSAVAGVILLVGFHGLAVLPPNYWYGIGCGLVTGLVYSGYILALSRARSRGVGAEQAVGLMVLGSGLILLLAEAVEGTPALPVGHDWLLVGLLALVVQVLGWRMIAANLESVPISRAGLALLCQPVLATIWGVMWLEESLSVLQLCGAAITLAAIYIGTIYRTENRKSG